MKFAAAPNSLEERAQSLFKNDLADESTVQHNVEQWLKAIKWLGPKWHLAETVKLVKIKKGKK